MDGVTSATRDADAIRRAALEWQVTLWSGEVTAEEHTAFERWLNADAAHESAWQQVQRLGLRLHAAPAEVAGEVLRTARRSTGRRKILRGLGLLVGVGVLAHAARETPQWQTVTADHATSRGERRDVTLPDGTSIALNTASAIDLRFTERERRVLLRAGEILVTTAHEAAFAHRPFVVETGIGTVRALGTRFTVRQIHDGSTPGVRVQVFEGAVEIAARHGREVVQLTAGEQARFTGTGIEPTRAVSPSATSWARGLLVVERERLEDFLVELARHRVGVLRCDPAVADLVVSGVYPLADIDAVLQSLALALPVRVSATTRYWVTVVAK